MKSQEWTAEFSRLMNAGLQGGVPPALIRDALWLSLIDLSNRQIMAVTLARSQKLSDSIVDSQGKRPDAPPMGQAGN